MVTISVIASAMNMTETAMNFLDLIKVYFEFSDTHSAVVLTSGGTSEAIGETILVPQYWQKTLSLESIFLHMGHSLIMVSFHNAQFIKKLQQAFFT